MSRYKFKLKPAGAIAPDLELTLKLPGQQKQLAPEVVEAVPCENTFEGWAVAVERGNETSLPGGSLRPWMFIAEDNPDHVSPYPDGCFWFYIEMIGTLCQGQTIDWTWDDNGASLPNLDITQDQDNPQLFYFYHNSHVLTTPSVFDGSTITLNATVGGATFGVPIYLAHDGAAYGVYWSSWSVFEWDLVNSVATQFSYFLFDEYQGDLVNGWALNGYIWRAADTLTGVVTQTLGPTVTLPVVMVNQCTSWYLYRNVGESYAGTEFTVQMQVDGNDFGDPLTFTCAV